MELEMAKFCEENVLVLAAEMLQLKHRKQINTETTEVAIKIKMLTEAQIAVSV